MSTRSGIGFVQEDGTIKGVYAHSDGYLSGVGLTLLEHYNTLEKVEELLSYGDISSLGDTVGEKHNFNVRDVQFTTFYMRDRDEEGCEAKEYSGTNAYLKGSVNRSAQYIYLFQDGVWKYSQGKDFVTFTKEDALQN